MLATQLFNSILTQNIQVHSSENCFWLLFRHLKKRKNDNTKQTSTESVNSEKTEAILIGTKQESLSIPMNILQLDYNYITVPLSDSVKIFGVLLDSTLSMLNLIK